MNNYEHLSKYKIKLKVLSPMFIGDGNIYNKTDYIFDSGTKEISIIDNNKLFSVLANKKMEDEYGQFIFSGNANLLDFLKDKCGMGNDDIKECIRYTVMAKNALDEKHSLKEIQRFIRNNKGEAYIPGSSLKGAIRTALLFSYINEGNKEHDPVTLTTKKRDSFINESKYFNTLKLSETKENHVNSIMRGISISDSEVIDDSCFTLAKKIDLKVDAKEKLLNVVRECLAPETEVCLHLTIDKSIVGEKITGETIMKSIMDFSDYYYENYTLKFDQSDDEKDDIDLSNAIFLGGGTGFFSKTVTYPYYGKNALKMIADYFTNNPQSSKHYHNKDIGNSISPHTLKYTEYDGWLYPMGACEVKII